MPSEPIEAEFAFPAALSPAQEEEYRQLEQEGPLSRSITVTSSHAPTIRDEVAHFKQDGYKIVEFDKGAGEDPREWSKGQKWYVSSRFFGNSFVQLVIEGTLP